MNAKEKIKILFKFIFLKIINLIISFFNLYHISKYSIKWSETHISINFGRVLLFEVWETSETI